MDYVVEDAHSPAEQAKAEALARLARQSAELQSKQEILSLLPADLDLPIKQQHGTAYKADGTVVFEMTSREQALKLLAKLPAVPVVLIRGGCVSFVPAERATSLTVNQTAKSVAGVFFSADGYGGGYIREGYRWWTRLGDKLVHIKVHLKMTCAGGVRFEAETEESLRTSSFISRPVLKVIGWYYHEMPVGSLIRWAGADATDPGELTVYWHTDAEMEDKFLSRGTHHKAIR